MAGSLVFEVGGEINTFIWLIGSGLLLNKYKKWGKGIIVHVVRRDTR
jgi:hypothetical protein